MRVKVCNVNVNGLSTKSGMLAEFASENEIDVIGVTETHLVSGISTAFVSIPNYNLFRCDMASGS